MPTLTVEMMEDDYADLKITFAKAVALLERLDRYDGEDVPKQLFLDVRRFLKEQG